MPDIFQTQANTQFDSFGNPINPANMNGGWGINPNLLTPSYDAPYRPQYQGHQPYNQYGRVGFFGGMNRLYNPFAKDPYWGNPIDAQQPSINAVSTRPFDAMAWAGQRVAAPALAFGAASRYIGPNTGTLMGDIGGYFTGKGIGAGVGQAFGRGVGSGVAGAFGLSGAAAGIVSGGAGVMGSVAGGLALEYGAAQAVLGIGQKSLWNPYINNRRSSQDLRNNFSGVTFGDARGNSVTGGGLGYQESARMGAEISHQGISDMTFSTGQYTEISDMAARSGLLDNVKAKQLTQRVKDVAAQIKLIVSISKDPDIKNAIEELSKLNLAGANVSGGNMSTAAGAYRSLGSLAAQSGVSVQRLMNTVGAQGQYLYQANGMTPYLGQLAAGNVFAGFSAANRSGLMSPAQLARMGGVEGATQASLTGQIAGSQTMYAQMAGYNQYISGLGGSQVAGRGQSVQNVIGGFGQAMAGDAIGTMGRMQYFGPQMSGLALQQNGSRLLEDQVASILGSTNAKRNRNGQYDAASMMPVLTNMMGLSEDQARAYIAQRTSEQDPASMLQRGRAIDRNEAEQTRSYLGQEKLYGGVMGVYGDVLRAGRKATNFVADRFAAPVNEMSGYVGDKTQSFSDWLQFGQTLGPGTKLDSAEALFNNPARTNTKLLSTGRNTGGIWDQLSGRSRDIRAMNDTINGMFQAGNSDAIAFLNETDPTKKRQAYSDLITKNKDTFGNAGAKVLDPNDSGAFDTYYDATVASQNVNQKTGDGNLASQLTAAVGSSTDGFKTDGTALVSNLSSIGAAYAILQSGDANAGNIDKIIADPKYASLKQMVGNLSGKALLDAVKKIAEQGGASGTLGLAVAQFQGGKSLDDYKKNPNLLSPAMRKRFLAATSDAERNLAVVGDQAQKNGRLLDPTIKNSTSMSVTDFLGATQATLQADKAHQDLFDKGSKSQFDYEGLQGISKNLDALSDASEKLTTTFNNLNDAASNGGRPKAVGWNNSVVGGAMNSWFGAGDKNKTTGDPIGGK